jgi:hypothetical protein
MSEIWWRVKKIWRVTVKNKSFSMISMNDITRIEALKFVRAKWADAEVE